LVGKTYDEHDIGLHNFAVYLITNIFDAASAANSGKDTSAGLHTVSANTATTSVHLGGGAGLTAVTFIDFNIETENTGGSDSPIVATVNNTITDGGVSGTFTITGTFTNNSGGNETWGNIGITITNAVGTFLVAHDRTNGAVGYLVSPLGTVAVTYTITVS
jgi:hypothetical protein